MLMLEDVLYKLARSQIWTSVDARDAFLKCKLYHVSRHLMTFWTMWGRMRWLKLLFMVSVASKIYQNILLLGLTDNTATTCALS